ncbi:CYTH domain-containing protein [Planctomonas sp. JC2975]|uniref:CYTH domain-containing protein n=1 Tax=Planctomonas sp. JC2975 TaxID=2729626 RepID=UPI0014767B55|nr:CYTH domain-containing protein [Planctomonas sp. JC2975]NNC13298.1 CYTH domain-containing protein [Planctomonas sp. JC2975]
MTKHGTSTIEIERKYDVTETAEEPRFVGVGPIAVVEAPEIRELDAVYYDTADLALAHARVALRRREGGPDAGWHVKRDAGEGRLEQHWAFGEGEDEQGKASVPDPLREAVRELVGDAELAPVARVRNHRVVSRLLDAAGYPVAEYCDDHVTGENLVTGGSETWREWEVELSAAAPDSRKARGELLDGLEAVVVAAGGHPSASSSKLERALSAS